MSASGVSWQDVTVALLARWPAQKWDRDQLAGYIAELQVDGLTPERAIAGLRASTSDFVPSVGKVTELYRGSLPPITTLDIQRAQEAFEARRHQALLEREASVVDPCDDDLGEVERA